MKTLHSFVVSFLVIMSSCQAQSKKETTGLLALHAPEKTTDDSLSRPDIRFKVNKRYDEKGNIIGYDSTYTYSYSGKNSAGYTLKSENISGGSQAGAVSRSSSFFAVPEWRSFLNDSALFKSFDNSYFKKQMEMQQKLMNDFFQQGIPAAPPGWSDKQNDHTPRRNI